ncbi:MAG TPA: FAD/NAD(P)-binding protein [Kaistia sp.]|nr:FAD/NAD(P)-binding protein [Kaistia sp.]
MPSDSGVPQVVIVGGGFCGAVLALHLARLAVRPLGITLIEPAADLGRGIAYAGDEPVHRINVPAARMAVFQDEPGDFDRYAHAEGAVAADPAGLQPNGDFYARRTLFGDYVGELLRAARAANPSVRIDHVRAKAVGLRQGSVLTDQDAAIAADALVLATGNPRPALPRPLALLAGDPRLVVDPWQSGALTGIASDASVLIVGTGLTMADIVAVLSRRGHRGAIVALSRHGLTQRRKQPGPYEPQGDFAALPGDTALELLQSVRAVLGAGAPAGVRWEDVIEAVRLQGRAIWRRLPEDERRRVVRHLRAFWDVHRYQVAPPVDDAVRAARVEGWLAIQAGTIQSATAGADGIDVAIRPRGRIGVETRRFGHVVNATGPSMHGLIDGNPFLADLAAQGLAAADPLQLGLHVGPDSRPVGSAPAPLPIFALGLLARGQFGELAGVRELSAQAAEVALALVRAFAPDTALPVRGDLLVIPGRHITAAPSRIAEPTC